MFYFTSTKARIILMVRFDAAQQEVQGIYRPAGAGQ